MFGFFLQEVDEQGLPLHLPLVQISQNYIKKKFLLDVITLLPLGEIGYQKIHHNLRVLWYIKCSRMQYLMFIFNPKLFKPMIDWFIGSKRKKYLRDQQLSHNMDEDMNFITLRIYLKNLMRIVSLIIRITIIVYLSGNAWFIVVSLQTDAILTESAVHDANFSEEDIPTTFFHNDNWELTDHIDAYRSILIQMYFMMTSLSTVGFGDYYPVNDFERVIGSAILLTGVTVFSYIMSKLADMIINFNKLTGESNDQQDIEKFMTLLQKFNGGAPINRDL